MQPHIQDQFYFEREARALGYQQIAGVDEAGRGPLAGPLVVAACILPEGLIFPEIDDSKKLTSLKREALSQKLIDHPDISHYIIEISPEEIDRLNILQATLYGMAEAVKNISADFALIDGNKLPNLTVPGKAIVKGDHLSYSIGAASVLAKVRRDHLMEELAIKWPGYGLEGHKGYPTKKHIEALERLGPTPIHRKSYAPVRRALAKLQGPSSTV